jgi:medium-chain acyl-[acyl-carrier-protein] hydrolase
VQLPGRGRRLREPLYTRMPALVEGVLQGIKPLLGKPFMFFGHSMGAMLSFELARQLRREKLPLPLHLFVSGRRAVQIPLNDDFTYNLPEPEFIGEISRLNGTPQEVLQHPELLSLILPVLRADFELVQTYEHTAEPPFDFPISALGGLDDHDVPWEQINAWREQTTSSFKLHMVPGDHFFLNTSRGYVLQIINRILRQGNTMPG